MQPRFSFVIVTYHNEETIAACLDSIETHVADPFEVIVVDNSRDLATAAAVNSWKQTHPVASVTCHVTGQNLGFARGCNEGVARTSGTYVFLLNPDTRLDNNAPAELAVCLETAPGAKVAGPAIFDEGGVVTRTCRNLPTVFRIALDACGLDGWFGAYKLTHFDHSAPLAVEQVIGAALLIRRSDYVAMDGMDDRFFIYFEEVDLCKRVRDSGGSVWFWPSARVTHWHGSSCESDSARARMIYVLRESRTKYFRKHFSPVSVSLVVLINRLEALQKFCILSVMFLLHRRPSHREKAKGFWAVATGNAPTIAGAV